MFTHLVAILEADKRFLKFDVLCLCVLLIVVAALVITSMASSLKTDVKTHLLMVALILVILSAAIFVGISIMASKMLTPMKELRPLLKNVIGMESNLTGVVSDKWKQMVKYMVPRAQKLLDKLESSGK